MVSSTILPDLSSQMPDVGPNMLYAMSMDQIMLIGMIGCIIGSVFTMIGVFVGPRIRKWLKW